MDVDGPHAGQPVETSGTDPGAADAAVVMVHGRGATARGILDLSREFPDGVAYLAPQAARRTWYPNSFMEPIESNQPHLDSALATVGAVLDRIEDAGIPPERAVLLGFSQGGCLATEYAARNARRYGGVVAFSGGLIGPEGTPRDYDGSFEETPAFLGCSDSDPHIPESRVHETADVLAEMGTDVEKRIYEGMGHTVVPDEVEYVDGMIRSLVED